MNIMEKATIQRFHRERLGRLPHQELAYQTEDGQRIRFEQLCKWGDFDGLSVMDMGCGYGDFRAYLETRFDRVTYLGVDLLDDFITGAERKYGHLPRTHFIQADFSQVTLPVVDVIVMSGSLNYRNSTSDYPWSLLTSLWKNARLGMAFNLLNANSFDESPLLTGYCPDEALQRCMQITPHCQRITDYLEHDFTMLMHRT